MQSISHTLTRRGLGSGIDPILVRALLDSAKEDRIERIVAGGVLLNQKEEFLVLRRAPEEKFLPGLCELPSGRVESSESLLDALAREIREETGLDIRSVDFYIGSFDYISGSGKQTRQFNFLVSPVQHEPVILSPSEHSEYFWVKRHNIDTFRQLGVSPISIIEKANEILMARCLREGAGQGDMDLHAASSNSLPCYVPMREGGIEEEGFTSRILEEAKDHGLSKDR